jgi:flavin reductase (DIM6/NTAB) family NADH-FMN oxidoreductase RutF/DNA-binding IclR family transcriptional regulator
MTAEESTDQSPTIDPEHYREVMGHYPTGVTVVTGMSPDGAPIGMVVGTFTSVSLDPPLVAFMPTTTSGTYALMRDSAAYCINVLAHDQLDLCRLMAVPRPGKFDDVAWSMSEHGAPVLHDAVAHIHCRPRDVVEAGDHLIVLCEVRDMRVTRPVTPLLFFQGGYGGFNPRGMSATGDADVIAAVQLAEVARPQVERIARQLACEAAVLVGVNDHELTTAVSAYGGAAEMTAPLGDRVPLMPPLGEAYVAWAGDEVVEAWLRRASSQTPEMVGKYRRRLAAVKERGFAVSSMCDESTPSYGDLKDAMLEYAAGGLTPARERAVRSVIADTSRFFETIDIDEERFYDLGSIVVPVLGPDGQVVLCLRATQLRTGVSGAEVLGWIAALKHAADAIAEQFEGTGREDYATYLTEYPGNLMM